MIEIKSCMVLDPFFFKNHACELFLFQVAHIETENHPQFITVYKKNSRFDFITKIPGWPESKALVVYRDIVRTGMT